ncbi:hypothetical protein TSUD_63450 [Trifolium subterraneum]|uniref:Uncharacterized protein n=1 Tax=Trifolium subterraneum TaxID=3900 RepID=A0A2Z6NIV1_TRISU|nr:hypothetical protein TSUD_63450 [Trifolium subterraneum]
MEFFKSGVGKFDLVPKGKSYEALIKGLCVEGRMDEGLKLQTEMVGKGQGNDEMAEALRKEMLQTPSAETTEQLYSEDQIPSLGS